MINRKTTLLLIIVCISATVIVLSKKEERPGMHIDLGIYDPEGAFDHRQEISVQSDFFSLNTDIENINDFLNKSRELNRMPLITLEPWEIDDRQKEYGQLVSDVCNAISAFKDEVWVRWGHEMELKSKRYPWSGKKPDDYIKAYNYFAHKCKEKAPNALFVWSPAGDSEAEKYWPNEKHVNFIGVSVYSYDLWEINNIGRQRSFAEIFNEKYQRMARYNKPIIVAEMGSTGTMHYKTKWFREAINSTKNYHLLKAMVYFNSKDVDGVWGKELDTPDWRLNAEALHPVNLFWQIIEGNLAKGQFPDRNYISSSFYCLFWIGS